MLISENSLQSDMYWDAQKGAWMPNPSSASAAQGEMVSRERVGVCPAAAGGKRLAAAAAGWGDGRDSAEAGLASAEFLLLRPWQMLCVVPRTQTWMGRV